MLHHWLHRHGFYAGKVKLFLFSSKHMYRGVKVKVPCLLNLRIAWKWYLISSTLVSSLPAAFLPFVVLQDIGCFLYSTSSTLQVHHPRCVLRNWEGGGYVKTQLSLYPIYYADDMFRPLWAILRSQNVQWGKLYSVWS